jgi:hypothetical protein
MAGTGQQSAREGATLFNLALPGLESATSYYGKLASGDPTALARANAPAIQQITGQTNAAKKNILQDMPRGGERNLALEEADINKGAQISQLTTGSYLSAFPSLAQLGGQNVSQGTQATGVGLQGMNASANQYGQLQNMMNEQKATQLGFITSLAGAGAEAAAGFCWVAAELWNGWHSYEAQTIREFLSWQLARGNWLWKAFVYFYVEFGQQWARAIQKHKLARKVTLWIFGRILRKAEERRRSFFAPIERGVLLWR